MHRGFDLRLKLVLVSAGLAFALLLVRTAYLSLVCHAELSREAEKQQTQLTEVAPLRGPILDRCGRRLACSVENPSLAVSGKDHPDLPALGRMLWQGGVCSAEQADEIAHATPAGFSWLTRRWVPQAVADQVRREHPAVRLIPEMKRFYPAGPFAPRTLGLVGTDGHGLSGLEWSFDDWLSGRPGQILNFVTGMGRPQETLAPQILREPQPGGGLVLSIDARVDEVVGFRLREAMEQVNATAGTAIALDPWTGEVLALCCEPAFDPMTRDPVPMEQMKVTAVTDLFEPGSTFKIATFSAALDGGCISPDDTINCLGGTRVIAGYTIHDLKKLWRVSAGEVLVYSSNIGTGLIAEKTGWERVYRMAQALGFGQPTGIELGGEASGSLPHPLNPGWSERSLATLAYGQEVSVTALQMALAYAAIANGGLLMKPLLVRARIDAAGEIVERFEPQVVRRVIAPETAETLNQLLRRVVTQGTAKRAEFEPLLPAGKTGTAQVYDPNTGTYSDDDHVLSFIGYAPYTNARCLVAVFLRCRGQLHGGDSAAPVFRNIIQDLMWLLEDGTWETSPIATATDGAPVLVPDVRSLAPEAARELLHRAGLRPVLEGLGTRVERVSPAPYAAVEPGSVVRLELAGQPGDSTVSVPCVEGQALRRAVALLSHAGLGVAPNGSGWIVRQSPEPGTQVLPGTRCEIWAMPLASLAREESLRRNDLADRVDRAAGTALR